MRLKSIYILFFILSCGLAQAQVTFVAKVSKSTLGINERLRIDFEMNQDGDNFVPPTFTGFKVVGGPNQAISNSWINGKRTYSKTYSYFLTPKAKGTFTIKQAVIEINGENYKTNPVKVIVTSAVKVPKDGNNADYVANENVHLVAEVSNSSPYLNEAITVVYKLYVSNSINVNGWRNLDMPTYADFWSQVLENNGRPTILEGTYQGKPYRYVVLQRAVLYPQKTGELIIEPLTLDVTIEVPGNTRDIFGRRRTTRVHKSFSAGGRTINVKPLPIQGKPDDFTGAVGDFQFNVFTNKTSLDANESLELKTKITGIGNLKLFDLPSLNLPSSLEVYEPVRDNQVKTNRKGMNGSVSESYTIIPQYKGIYPVRPIAFSYFDLKTETYKTISSDEIIINVENGPVPNQVTTDKQNTGARKEVVIANDQFKYIKLKADLEAINQPSFFKSELFWWLSGAPFLLIPLFIIAGNTRRKRLSDVDGKRLRKATKLAKKYLSEAKKNIGKQEAFYEALERALHNYLRAKLDIVTSEFSKEKIADLLSKRRVEQEVNSDFISLLKSCEFARYTPTSNVTIQHDYKKAVSVISSIDKQFTS